MKHVLTAVALLMVITACGGASVGSDSSPPDGDVLARGAELYAASCAECHGLDLRGTDRGPSHLSVVYEPSHHSDGAFLVAVLAGSPQHHWEFGPMPPIPGLTEDDVAAIVSFVRQRQREEGFEPYPPP